MKILADHCIPPSLVKVLLENNLEVIQTKEIRLEKSADEMIFDYAFKNSLVLFTFDHDFGDTTRFDIRSSYGVVIIYIERITKESIFGRAVKFFTTTKESELRGKLFVLEPKGIRIWPK